MPSMLRIKRISEKEQEYHVYLTDKEGTDFIAIVPMTDQKWYGVVLEFAEAIKKDKEVYLTHYDLKPGTRQINPAAEFKSIMAKPEKIYTVRTRKDLDE